MRERLEELWVLFELTGQELPLGELPRPARSEALALIGVRLLVARLAIFAAGRAGEGLASYAVQPENEALREP